MRGGAVGEGDEGEIVEDGLVEGEGIFKRADEGCDGLRVGEEGGEREIAGGGEEGNADMAGHPDSEVGHEPPGAVLGDDDDVRARGEVLGVDPGGDAADLLHGACPGPVEKLAVVDWLREERLRCRGLLARVDSVERQLAIR